MKFLFLLMLAHASLSICSDQKSKLIKAPSNDEMKLFRQNHTLVLDLATSAPNKTIDETIKKKLLQAAQAILHTIQYQLQYEKDQRLQKKMQKEISLIKNFFRI